MLMITHANTDVLTAGLVIHLGNKKSIRSCIDTMVVNKLIIDTRIEILYLRQTCVSSTKGLSVTFESKHV